jgi:protein kinase X
MESLAHQHLSYSHPYYQQNQQSLQNSTSSPFLPNSPGTQNTSPNSNQLLPEGEGVAGELTTVSTPNKKKRLRSLTPAGQSTADQSTPSPPYLHSSPSTSMTTNNNVAAQYSPVSADGYHPPFSPVGSDSRTMMQQQPNMSRPPPSPTFARDCLLRLGQKTLSDLVSLVRFMETTDPQSLRESQLPLALSIVNQFTQAISAEAAPPISAQVPMAQQMLPPTSQQQSSFAQQATAMSRQAQPYRGIVPTTSMTPPPPSFPSTSTPSSPPGLSLDYFVLMQTLGTGTFGKVRLCRQKTTNKFFCLKILSKERIVQLKQTEHVKSEKSVLAQISHPFIVKLYATFQDRVNLYFLLEYVSGGELFSCIRRSGRLPNTTARFYAAEIVLAIRYLHSLNIAHRDLKPENLLLDSDGHVKLSDFGFAKYIGDKTWTMCGTPEYIAPEIILSKGHDKAVDWWSLGVLIYEMLVGRPPFYGEHHFEIFEKILSRKFDMPNFLHPEARDLIDKLLVVDITKRLGSARGGVEEVMRHPWFSGLDWDALYMRQIRAPINPGVTGEGDTHNFARYSEHSVDHPREFEEGDLFKDF